MLAEKNFFHLSFDTLKWLFSFYDNSRHRVDIEDILLSAAALLCERNYNLVCDASLYKSFRDKLIKIAAKSGYQVIEANLKVSPEILADRFEQRVVSATATPGSRISNISPDRFKKLVGIYDNEKNPSAKVFRSDEMSSRDIAAALLEDF